MKLISSLKLISYLYDGISIIIRLIDRAFPLYHMSPGFSIRIWGLALFLQLYMGVQVYEYTCKKTREERYNHGFILSGSRLDQ